MILYLMLIFAIRLMGKRQLGQMEPTEFVVTMLIADLASVPMQDVSIPLLSGLIPILVILAMELLLSVLVYNSISLRRFFCGKPVILIADGKLLVQNMKKTRVSADELREYLRLAGYYDLEKVRYAILETNGNISVMPYAKYAPAEAKDAQVKVQDENLSYAVISRGKLNRQNLALSGHDEAWVQAQLRAHNAVLSEVYLLTAERGGKVYLVRSEAAK